MTYPLGRVVRKGRTSGTGLVGRMSRKYRAGAATPPQLTEAAARVHTDLACELPDEDLAEDLSDSLDLYIPGSKPRCEEQEFIELVEAALDQIAREQ